MTIGDAGKAVRDWADAIGLTGIIGLYENNPNPGEIDWEEVARDVGDDLIWEYADDEDDETEE